MGIEESFGNAAERRDPNLPSNEFIHNHTKVIGGEVLILGLSPQQAEALQKYAEEKGVMGEGENRMKLAELSASDVSSFKTQGFMDEDSVTIYLGHTSECHKPLFESLGIIPTS